MVLYPQVYSTVNQNQIHLHLHSDKIEPYLNTAANGLTIGSGRTGGIEIGIGTTDNVIMESDDTDQQQQQQHSQPQQQEQTDLNQTNSREDEQEVWRPYHSYK